MLRFTFKDLLLLIIIVAAAGGIRAGYLTLCMDDVTGPAPLRVQDNPDSPARTVELSVPPAYAQLPALAHNIKEHQWGGSLAPLADVEERTAHAAPGYPWLVGRLARLLDDPATTLAVIRWSQVGFGSLTAGLYFLFARRAFRSAAVGFLAGLLCTVHPFWVISTAELADGVLASFLLAASLFFGARGAEEGDATSSLLYGLALAGLALTRAALLPFALVGCLWFLWRCREVPRGWLCALLAFLGLANGLTPWTARNWQVFHDLVPVADSLYLHLWVGVNSAATGGPQDEITLRSTLPPARRKQLLEESNQARRYGMLAHDVKEQLVANPAGILHRRLLAGQAFVFGASWFTDGTLARAPAPESLPPTVAQAYPAALEGTLLGMLVFGLIGWRWSYGWRRESMPASLAVFWIPLPYLLSHAEMLSGPRLPLDGVLLCYGAFALLCLVPGLGRRLRRGSLAGHGG